MSQLCPCGEPLHYATPETRELVEGLIEEKYCFIAARRMSQERLL